MFTRNQGYAYSADDAFFNCTFDSKGPKGYIRKVARFSPVSDDFYNFGFGDLIPSSNIIDDTSISNNGDGQKILKTVGSIIFDFTTLNPEARIFCKGTTKSRTRLYQIAINKFYPKVSLYFTILGQKGDVWKPFEKGCNYDAFVGFRKLL